MKRVILTGGSGFVGANLVRRLLHDGHELHLLLRPEYATWRLIEILGDVRAHEIDLRDQEGLANVISSIQPEWIFHLATYGAYSTQNDVRCMVQTNFLGTINLVESCLKTGFEAFVNTGSSSEYGLKDQPTSENEPLEPNSEYAVTKASATLFCHHIATSRAVHIPTLRLYSVYGPYEERSRLVPTLIVRGLHGELPPLVNPETARDFVYVDDVVDAYISAATEQGQEPGPIFNVGTGVQTTLGEAVAIAQRALGMALEPKWKTMAVRSWDTNVWLADNTKIRTVLGWKPRFNFEQGFRATIEWFQQNPALVSFYSSS